MTDTFYDNPSHWKAMHTRYGGSLKAVGRSGLSETYNRYKYRSEEETFIQVLNLVLAAGGNSGLPLKVLEIGAGTGYWLRVVKSSAGEKGIPLKLTALDLSGEALERLSLQLPGTECLTVNAGLAKTDLLAGRFDLVMANYCLHHITNTTQFLNALQLAVNSVKPGGYLMLMDCFIDRPYSPYYSVDPETYTGSGLSRKLDLVDQVCSGRRMKRIMMVDPISYLMNNVLEDKSERAFQKKSRLWRLLHRLYKSETISRFLMPLVFPVDRYLKNKHRGFSTRLLLYHKQES